jgi:hypothetical protein
MKEQSEKHKTETSVRYVSAGGHAMPIYETRELLNNEKDKNERTLGRKIQTKKHR